MPRSRMERTPRSFWAIELLGISLGGVDAASEKGLVDFISSEAGSQSKILRIVLKVPPLAPEVLFIV